MKFLVLFLLLFVVSCGKEEAQTPKPVVWVLKAKDPVCGMWVERNKPNYQDRIVMFDNARYYFCADECVIAFTKNPTKYVKACDCKKFNRDCQCEHCEGKLEPCDCGS